MQARSQAALGRLAAAYEEPLSASGPGLRDLCYTASVRREHWDRRLAVVGASPDEMAVALREHAAGVPSGRWHIGKAAPKSRLVFLFPGQGGWRPGVGGGL